MNLASQWTIGAEYLEIESDSVAAKTVEQIVYLVEKRKTSRGILSNIINENRDGKITIFTNRRDEARKLQEYLSRKRIDVELLSGEITQSRRLQVLEKFKRARSKCWLRPMLQEEGCM